MVMIVMWSLINLWFMNFCAILMYVSLTYLIGGNGNCRNLRELDLRESEVEDICGHWLCHFPDSYTSLVSLNISCLANEVNFPALERLVSRCPNLQTLRLNRAAPLDKLANLLRGAPQLVEIGTGAYTSEMWPEVFSNLTAAFSGCMQMKTLSGFWDVLPSYLPAVYPVCSRLTSLNLSYATIQSPDLIKLVGECGSLQRLWVCLVCIKFSINVCLCLNVGSLYQNCNVNAC